MLRKTEGGRRRDNRGWDGWMASPTQWTWVWVNPGSWWWTGRPGMLQSMGPQRVREDWTELNWSCQKSLRERGIQWGVWAFRWEWGEGGSVMGYNLIRRIKQVYIRPQWICVCQKSQEKGMIISKWVRLRRLQGGGEDGTLRQHSEMLVTEADKFKELQHYN